MKRSSLWYKSRRRNSLRRISDVVDRGLYAIILLKSSREGIDISYDEEQMKSELNDCIELLDKLAESSENKTRLDDFELEVLQKGISSVSKLEETVDKMKEYLDEWQVNSNYDEVVEELRKIEAYLQRQLRNTGHNV